MSISEDFKNEPSAKVPNLVGRIIDGNYYLTEKIGCGAWGVVYHARAISDPLMHFAVKCISIAKLSRTQQRAIESEVGLHNVCSNASERVLKILDFVDDDDDYEGLLFIVTEYCPDGDLLTHIHNGKYLGKDDLVKTTFVQILDAVLDCHRCGVYHRDIKPENILLKKEGIVLCDFGFATTTKYASNFHMGSEPYMSPEVCRGIHTWLKAVSAPLSDIWALGVILMNLITGYLPWEKATIKDMAFFNYFYDRNYLYRRFPISREANEIFKSIFTIDPLSRTSIETLRERVLAVNTFRSDERSESDLLEVYSGRHFSNNDILFDTNFATSSFLDLADIHTADPQTVKYTVTESPPLATGLDSDHLSFPRRVVSAAAAIGPFRSAGTPYQPPIATADMSYCELDVTDKLDYNDSDSDTDSEGPVTPETRAADASGVGVPVSLDDINDFADLDLSDGPPGMEEFMLPLETTTVPSRIAFGKGQPKTLAPEPFADYEMVSVADSDADLPAKNILWSAARMLGLPIFNTQ